jgi:hypothetical protein
LTAYPILFLPPNDQVEDVLDSSPEFHRKFPNPVFDGFVSYEDLDGNHFKEAFSIDLTYLKKRIYVSEGSVVDEFGKLNKSIARIADHFDENE